MRWLVVALVACGGTDEVEGGWNTADFLPPEGMALTFIPPDEPDGPELLVVTSADRWEVDGGALDVAFVGGALEVDGAVALPAQLVAGQDGVVSLGERETWYGTFPRAVTVEIPGGRLAGEAAFAEGIGPVFLTLDGEPWDLATYEQLEP